MVPQLVDHDLMYISLIVVLGRFKLQFDSCIDGSHSDQVMFILHAQQYGFLDVRLGIISGDVPQCLNGESAHFEVRLLDVFVDAVEAHEDVAVLAAGGGAVEGDEAVQHFLDVEFVVFEEQDHLGEGDGHVVSSGHQGDYFGQCGDEFFFVAFQGVFQLHFGVVGFVPFRVVDIFSVFCVIQLA